MQKRIISMLIVAVLLSGLSVLVFAHDTVDMERNCSIRVTMHCGETAVGGGNLTIYRVGEVVENNGDYSFALTGDFLSCGESLENISSSSLAERLGAYVEQYSLKGDTKDIPESGTLTFQNLKPGLYLIVQFEAAFGYNCANAFLVSVPVMRDGTYYYDLDASPKIEVENAPVTPVPSPTPTPAPSLPQTGQLNWPIPVLIICGLGLCIVGWGLRGSGKKNEDEA